MNKSELPVIESGESATKKHLEETKVSFAGKLWLALGLAIIVLVIIAYFAGLI
jgi:hypothetical protein